MSIPDGPDAAVFDLDGVVTFTAEVHAAAWKQLFDDYLRQRQWRHRESFREFTAEDYRAYVDGRPRYQGVQTFLNSRGIYLPYGDPADSPERDTVCGLGNRKNGLFLEKVQEMGVTVDDEAVRFIRELEARDVRIGLASSSKNAGPILDRVGLTGLFAERVDGMVSELLGLRGKPEPDIFLTCLERLTGRIEPGRAMVVEDAISGVEAGRRGGFGLVLGVDRNREAEALRHHGADWVISKFHDISATQVLKYFQARARVA